MTKYYVRCKMLKSVVVEADCEEDALNMMYHSEGSLMYLSGSFKCDEIGE